MQKQSLTTPTRRDERLANTPSVGLPVRTNLRAGLAWDDLDDQAAALWGKLTSAVSDATSSVTGSTTSTTTS